jgi:hypothetical protein
VTDIVKPPVPDGTPAASRPVIAGRYAVQRELGRGGAAVVYLARDEKHERMVAVKVLKPELAGVLGAERFLRETLITAALQHPNLLAILDSGENDGIPYYVTPYLEGGSLRARLERDRQLALDDALGLAHEIADALEYAHGHGVLHRDIKPDNILYSADHACLADFGIAQALERSAGDRLTSTGIVLGTPLYMSPEQAAGERLLDARSDVYSLACVLYEALAGVPPFVGATANAVIAQRLTSPPRPLRVFRPAIPEHVDAALQRAMLPEPADRTRSAAELAAELGVPIGRRSGARRATPSLGARAEASPRRRWKTHATLATAALALVAGGWGVAHVIERGGAGTGDANRYVVAVSGSGGSAISPDVARAGVEAALRHWRGLEVAALTSKDSGTVITDVDALARRMRAGHVIALSLAPVGDSVALDASLFDAGGPRRRHASGVVARDATDGAYRELVAELLRDGDRVPDVDEGDLGTDRLEAWRAYQRAQRARVSGDLDAAARELRAALAIDAGYPQALLWLAQIEAWRQPTSRDDWRDASTRAALSVSRLSRPDSLMARAVQALADERYPEACAAFERLREYPERAATAWLGLAHCRTFDQMVLRDASSASGWSFRSSRRAAVAALDSAVARLDVVPDFVFRELGALLITEPSRLRTGNAESGSSRYFAAYPSISADTLAFVPYPAERLAAMVTTIDRSTLSLALRRNTDMLAERFRSWTARAPRSARARELLALAQEARGDRAGAGDEGPAALATLDEARRLSTDSLEQLRLATHQVRVIVKDGRFTRARQLADSILTANERLTESNAGMLAGIAALVGRVDRAAAALRMQSSGTSAGIAPGGQKLPPIIAAAVADYTVLAASGACTDSLRSMVATLDALLERHVTPAARAALRPRVLSRPLGLAVPCLGARSILTLAGEPTRLVRMQRALAEGDTRLLRAEFDTLRLTRQADRPGDVALDYTVQEAWLLLALGDTTAAVRRLDLSLEALSTLSTRLLDDVPQALALGRAMVMRAELAASRGDSATARRWAGRVVELWGAGGGELKSVMERMKRAG